MKATLYGLTKNKNDIHVKSQLEKMLAEVSADGAAVIDGVNIAAESIYGKSIVAGSIEATQIKAGTITSDHITTNGIVADKIKTGVLRSTNGVSWLNLNDGTFSYANGNFTFQGGKMVVRAHTIELGGKEVPTKTETEEYADGKITAEKERAIADSQAKLDEAKKYVDDMEVGGRNLALDSNFDSGEPHGWHAPAYYTESIVTGIAEYRCISSHSAARLEKTFKGLEVGQRYTLTIYAQIPVAGQWRGFVGGTPTYEKVITPTTDRFMKHSVTFETTGSGTTSDVTVRLYTPGSPIGTKIHMDWYKLEKGSKATDWTPAPEDITASITSINDQALAAAKKSELVSPFISGTQTATTGTWTGVAPFESLVDGQQITYWLPTSPSGNATLNLNLAGGGTTGAINCYYSGATRLTTHYAAGNVIRLTYRQGVTIGSTSYTGWWADANYVDGNNYDRTRYNTAITAKSAVSAGRIIVSDDVGFFHLAKGSNFDYTKPILYAASAIASGGTQTNNYTTYPAFTLRNNDSGITLTSGKAVYLKGSLSGTTFTVNSSTLFTDNPDNDGSVYLLLGQMQTTVNVLMYPQHDLYQFSEGVFKSFAQIASESSAMIEAWRMPDKVTINGGMLEAGTVSAYHLVVGSGEVGERNLARGIVAASGDYTGSLATDGNKAVGSTYATFGTGNISGVGPEGSYLQVDLGSTFKVAQSQAYFYSADTRNYWYKIKYSVDGTRWFYAVGTEDNDGWVASPPRTNGASIHPTVDTFAPLPITARFVRLYGNGNNINSTNHIYEWELYESPQTRIYGDQIETGLIKSAAGNTSIDLDNGHLKLGTNLVWNGSTLTVKGNIDASSINTGTLATSRIPDLSADKITSGSINAARIAANTITATHIASRTITTDRIVANAITANEIASGTITATEIKSRTITTDRIATNAITANEINVANLSALSANLGNVTAGTITSTNGLIDINLNTGVINLGQPLTIKSKPVATKGDLDGLEIGGRNLLKNQKSEWSELGMSASSYFWEEGSDYKVEVGQTYTFSVIVEKISTDTVPINMHLGLGSTAGSYTWDFPGVGRSNMPMGTKVSITFTVKATDGASGYHSYFAWRLRNELRATTIRYKEAKLEKGSKATDWTPAPEDIQEEINAIETRVNDAELLITPEAITATVVESEDLTSKLKGYATQESLGGYISSDDFTTEKDNMIGEIDSRIGAIDYSPFVQTSELEQKTNAITAKFSQAGGVNLIQNSIGWAGKDFWSNFSATAGVAIQNDELSSMGFGSGWYSSASGYFLQKQRLTLPRAGTYTLSFWLKKTAGSSWAFVQVQKGADTTFANANAFAYTGYQGAKNHDAYELYSTTFEATELDVAVSININTGVEATITGIMLHEGSEPFKWQPYTSEVYNTNVKMDINGITVKNNQDAGYTLITPDEFSGYAPVDGTVEKVFTLNGDTTEVKKLKAEQQFQMAPVTIITIDNSKYSGWAFI